MNRNIGSAWAKWDLHIHTPFSHLNNKFDNKIKEYLELIASSDIEVFGLTNYFNITDDEYNKVVVPARMSKRCFLNVEFRMSQPNRAKEFINVHVIFNDSIEFAKIKSCLSRVSLINSLDGKAAYCCEQDLDRIGYDIAVVEFKSLIDQLDKDFKEKEDYILLAPTNGYGGFRPEEGDGRGKAIAVEIDRCVHAIFGSSQKDHDYFLNINRYAGANPKPVFKSSDSHKIEDIGLVFTWVKSRSTYEGLVETIHEPKDRVLVSGRPERLDLMKSFPEKYIKTISINSATCENEWFDKVGQIELNPGLISIIGNKGSGKSALADIIALTGNSNVSEFTFLNRTKYLKNPSHKKYSATIEYHNLIAHSKKFSDKYDPSRPENVLYLTQEFIEQLCSEIPSNDKTRLRDEIDKVILNHIPDEERLGFSNITDLINHFKNDADKSISESEKKIRALNDAIVTLELKTSKTSVNKHNSLIKDISDQIEKHLLNKPTGFETKNNSKESQRIQRYEYWKNKLINSRSSYQSILSSTRKNRDSLDRAKISISNLKQSYEALNQELAYVQEISEGRVVIAEIVKLSINLTPIDTEIQALVTKEDSHKLMLARIAGIIVDIDNKINALTASLAGKTKEIEAKRIEIKAWDDKLNTLKGNATTPNTLEYEKVELEKIDSTYKVELDAGRLSRKAESKGLLKLMHEREEKLSYLYSYSNKKIEEIAKEFNIDKNDFISFSSERIVSQEITSELLSFVNQNKSGTYFRYGDRKDGFIDKLISSIHIDDIESIATIPENILKSLSYTIQNPDDNISALTENSIDEQLKKQKNELYNFIYSFKYLKNQFTIRYGGKPIEYLSPGEKGILLLSFFLLFDSSGKPIIIDQPEENLDNETIYKRLVMFIRKAKANRQIILVTHNPNLSIVCDSEQVIVATIHRENKNVISYDAGAIEDKEIKAFAMKILEGTKPAFESRMNKYSIKTAV